MELKKNFIGSRMNKSVDERFLPEGEYVHAENIRVSSSQDGEGYVVENNLGNVQLTSLSFVGTPLSDAATCIGSFAIPRDNTIIWFVTEPGLGDMIVSYNEDSGVIKYHVVTVDLLNFSEYSRITGINLIDNFLFFTDDRNPPRVIDITRSYKPPIAGVDKITEDDISVIKKPPINPPTVSTIADASGENFLEDKFVAFATRYRFTDGTYSAPSMFTDFVFSPGVFRLDYETFDMIGMLNIQNKAIVNFDTGPKNVEVVEVLFKESHSNIIKVIDRFKKVDLGWGHNQIQQISFDNSKIYNTLLESETLRIYDNVPKLAKAQTVIGNRLNYGNYLEGYDIDTVIDFDVDLISEDFNGVNLPVDTFDVDYTTFGAFTKVGAGFEFDMSGLDLKKGAVLILELNFEHDSFEGDPGYPGDQNDFTTTIAITLTEDYNFTVDFFNSVEFQKAIGGAYAQPFGSCANGFTLDDLFSCSISPSAGWTFVDTSLFNISIVGDVIKIEPPVVRFEENAAPGTYAEEYFRPLDSTAYYRELGSNESLHSDRDYEVRIIYMDEYLRSSTPLASRNNTVKVPKNASDKKNYIQTTINHTPPSWARYYKFAIKPSHINYESIYSNLFYRDYKTGTWYVRLVGDNISKAKEGDRLIIKRDTGGVNYSQPRTKILSLGAKEENFIDVNNTSGPQEPTGVYMEVNANFAIDEDPDSFVTYGPLRISSDAGGTPSIEPGDVEREGISIDNIEDTVVEYYRNNGIVIDEGPRVAYPTYWNTNTAATRTYEEYDIPEGSVVSFYIKHHRNGDDRFKFLFEEEFVATRNYDNLYDFILGENVDFTVASNDTDADSQTDTPTLTWTDTIETVSPYPTVPIANQKTGMSLQYVRLAGAGSGGEDVAFLSAISACDTYNGNTAYLQMNIEVQRSVNLLVFETEPLEGNDSIFYEGTQIFEIENGLHKGNVQDQSTLLPAISTLNFFDCFSFGNGVESMKVRDALDGREITLGSRVYTTSEKEFREIRRGSDITYSGVYNEETNVNNTNVFNLALANFKPLEQLYGDIQILHARNDNILVLQEDKISYVLANGKDLFSDAQAGGAILNVPQVLGRQVFRVEEYGISDDPDSFVAWGSDVWFTDRKRNAVLSLKGGSEGESLDVISDYGMGDWFRNLYRDKSSTYKIGAYDPFNDEYVLSITSQSKENVNAKQYAGTKVSQELSNTEYSYDVILGESLGTVDIDYEVTAGSITISVVYNGSEVVNSVVTGSGTLTFNKDEADVDEATITITPVDATYELTVQEVEFDEFTIIMIVTNDETEATYGVDVEFTLSKVSPLAQSKVPPSEKRSVILESDSVSLFSSLSGVSGTGNFPEIGDSIVMKLTETSGRPYRFQDGIDKFKYLVSDTLYTEADVVSTLRPLLTETAAPANISEGVWQSSFGFANPSNYKYLYIVWDLYDLV